VQQRPIKVNEMTDEEFERFVQGAIAELSRKQDRLTAEFGLGGYARWDLDEEAETLAFFDATGRKALRAEVIQIGSYASNRGTWKWGWSNDSVLPHVRKKAEPLKELAVVTGFHMFAEAAAMSVDEHLAWELAAISARHLDALGVYRAPSSSRPLASFLAITDIQRIAS
jgi:hypothetical protein